MDVLAIARPLPLALAGPSSDGAGRANLLSPNPREAFVAAAAGDTSLVFDLGAAQAVDTFFLGYTNAAAGAAFRVYVDGAPDPNPNAAGSIAQSYRWAPLRHGAIVLPAPIVGRYVRLAVTTTAPLVAGIAAIGRSIRPGSGHERGSGRPIADTSRVERLFDGSFGTAAGRTAGGWQWTMPALSDDEAARLYALALDVGIGGEVIVIEPGFDQPGGNEAIHWGKLAKLEPYARQEPGETRWDLQVQDWA